MPAKKGSDPTALQNPREAPFEYGQFPLVYIAVQPYRGTISPILSHNQMNYITDLSEAQASRKKIPNVVKRIAFFC